MIVLILGLYFWIVQCEGLVPIVATPLGKIQGYYKTNYKGTKFLAFEGIPYAVPPIGSRRFEEPEPVQPWFGIWNASFTYSCAQITDDELPDERGFLGKEDCLYLNIYVPRERLTPFEKLDVLVHIHGGLFSALNATFYARPDFFMEQEVIFVTMNYRLGVFGFLSTEDDVIPGNNGLKDQVMALKWIQDNIASFGGNPKSVTLTGLSSGGACVHLHYFSPMSRGLFHKGFSQSGCALNPWVIQTNPLEKAKRLGDSVGCPRGSNQILAKCLKQKSYWEILTHLIDLKESHIIPALLWGPVVEKSPKPFLSENPYQLLKQGLVHDLPWMTSTVSHEGISFTNKIFKNNIETSNSRWNELAPFWLFYYDNFPRSLWTAVANKIKGFYLGDNQEVTSKNFQKFVQIFSDRLIVDGATEAAKLQASTTNSSVYYYQFSYPQPHRTIVQHGEDLFFFYYKSPQFVNDYNIKMKDLLVNMLVSYAKSGHPAINGLKWPPTRGDQLTYVNISTYKTEEIEIKTVKEFGFEKFWASLGLGHGDVKSSKVEYSTSNFI